MVHSETLLKIFSPNKSRFGSSLLIMAAVINITTVQPTEAAPRKPSAQKNSAIRTLDRRSDQYIRPRFTSSDGLRLSLSRPFFETSLTQDSYGDETFKGTFSYSHSQIWSLGVGYVSIPLRGWGWSLGASLYDFQTKNENETRSWSSLKFDGQGIWAQNKIVSFKFGPNISKVTRGQNAENMDVGVGFQLGTGFQFNPRFGLDIQYVQMNSYGKSPVVRGGYQIDTANTDQKTSGFEALFHVTF